MRQGQAALIVVALWLVMGAVGPSQAEVTWDTGYEMHGQLEDKEIVLPISLESPSTDTMECTPAESDHWIDPEESQGQDEGDDPDAYANWESTKCWWWAQGGNVTQHSWTTTWTAPETQGGIFRLETSIEDLPKACSKGTRDDARAYAGTGYAGGGGMQMAAAGGAPPPARAYSAVLQKSYAPNDQGTAVESDLRYSWFKGAIDRNNLTDLDIACGFFKKVEWIATITPSEPPIRAPGYFEWVQKEKGEIVVDGSYAEGPYTSWHDDSPGAGFRTNIMSGGKVYFIDGPGAQTTGTQGDWFAPAGDHSVRFSAVSAPAQPYLFLVKLKFQGKKISTNYGNEGSGDWSRHLRIGKTMMSRWSVTNNE